MEKIQEISKFRAMIASRVPFYDIEGKRIAYTMLTRTSFARVLFMLDTGQIWYKKEDFPN